MAEPTDRDQSHAETTVFVRGAVRGDAQSIGWVVTHFTPFLLVQAKYRLGRHLQGMYDPEDLVQRTWMVALPRLRDINSREGRFTPVLMKFLSAVLLQDYRNLLAKHMDKPIARQPDSGSGDPLTHVAASTTGVEGRAVRGERIRELREALERLSDEDREVVILHGVEQLPFKVIAAKLEANESTLRSRYHRALQSLKGHFPASMISEMEEA